MAVRRVEIRLTSTGFDKVFTEVRVLSHEVDKLIAKFKALGMMEVKPKVKIDGLDADKTKIDDLSAKLTKIDHTTTTAKVKVDLDDRRLRLAIATDRVLLAGLRLQASLSGQSIGNDKLVSQVDQAIGDAPGGSRWQRILANLFWGSGWMGKGLGGAIPGAAGQAAGGAAAGGGAGGAGALAGMGPVGIGALVAAIGSLVPALVPLALGLGIGGAGALGAYHLDPKAFSKVGADISKQFLNALTQQGPGHWANIHGGHPEWIKGDASFLTGILGILKQVGGFINQIGPQLGGMFRASLPFLNSFVQGMEYFGKLLLPIITQSLKSFAPFLPIISQGFQALAQGIAYFIKDLGPGMKDAAIIFKAAMIAIKGILIAAAYIADGLAIAFVKLAEWAKVAAHRIRQNWDTMRHDIAVIFDNIRHEIAHIWDMTWNDTIGRLIRADRDIQNWFTDIFRSASRWFDNTRSSIARIWDTTWNQTIGRIIRGVGDVGRWFTNMKHTVDSALAGLPGDLYNIGVSILNGLLSGLKAAAGPLISFVNWVHSLISSIGSFLGFGGNQGGPARGPNMGFPVGARGPMMSAYSPVASSTAPGPAYGPSFFVVNFNGVQGNPDAIAQQIHQLLRDYKQHRGKMPLGLA